METFLICSHNKKVFSINNDPIRTLEIKDFTFEKDPDAEFVMICPYRSTGKIRKFTPSPPSYSNPFSDPNPKTNLEVIFRFYSSTSVELGTKTFTFQKNILGTYSPTSDLWIRPNALTRSFTIDCNIKWCFSIKINGITVLPHHATTRSGLVFTEPLSEAYILSEYKPYNNSDSSNIRWYDRATTERLLYSCSLIIPPLYLSSRVIKVFIRASDNYNTRGYNIGIADRDMMVYIDFAEPLRMPVLEVFVLKDDFTLKQLTWQQFQQLFDHNSVIVQRHSYTVEL